MAGRGGESRCPGAALTPEGAGRRQAARRTRRPPAALPAALGAAPLRGCRRLRPATRGASAVAGRKSAFPVPAAGGLRGGAARGGLAGRAPRFPRGV